MLYRVIIAVCSQIHTKHINTLCGQNVELLNVNPSSTYSINWAVYGLSAIWSCDARHMRITDHSSTVAALTAAISLTPRSDVPVQLTMHCTDSNCRYCH